MIELTLKVETPRTPKLPFDEVCVLRGEDVPQNLLERSEAVPSEANKAPEERYGQYLSVEMQV